MKKHSQRAQRVGEQIQRELAELLRDHVKDPRVGRVTVTAVEVSPDLSHAKVFVTHLAGAEHADEAVTALQRTAGFLRTELAHRMQLYSVPQEIAVEVPAIRSYKYMVVNDRVVLIDPATSEVVAELAE